MPPKLLLIDGMYLVFSSFYSHRHMSTLKGEPTGAVYGFVTRVEALIQELAPESAAVAFDSREKNFRARLYPEYKGKRQLPPEELLAQIPPIKEYLEARGIPFFERPGFEADDIIAFLAHTCAPQREVVIFSADKDLFQLIGPGVFVYHPKLKQKLDREGVKEFFGVYPEQIVDYLLLVGDASDNIPGVAGVGEKTATKLIEAYGSVENMLKQIDRLDPKNAERIRLHQDKFEWTRNLLDFDRVPEIPGPFTLAPLGEPSGERLEELYRRLSFQSLQKKGVKPKAATPGLDLAIRIVRTRPELRELCERIRERKECGIDIETTGLDFFRAEIVGLSIAFDDGGYYVPMMGPAAEAKGGILTPFELVAELKRVLEDPAIKKVGHNLKFDMLHLRKLGIDLRGLADDSMVMSYLIFPNRRTHGLKELTAEFLGHRQVEFDELVGKGKAAVPLVEVPIEAIARYCIEDSYFSLRLAGLLRERLRERKLGDLYSKIELPLVSVLAGMEYAGVKVDRPFLLEAKGLLEERIEQTAEEVFRMAGIRFNLNSSQQLGELLFSKMNLPQGKKTRKTKAYSTDIDVLTELKGFPVVERIIEYRTFKKLLSTYVDGLLAAVDGEGRVHTSFNQAVTATGRLSSSSPNLQNVPVGEMGGVVLRRAFVAEKGWRLLSADYSQVELRVMAHFSEDEGLIEAFSQGRDIHQHTADQVFGSSSTPRGGAESRRRAKIINFSIIYGSGPFSLSKELGVPVGEAKAFIEKYFETYRGVKAFMDRVIAETEKDPEVRTIAGRLRPIPEIQSQNRTVKENGQRMAINSIIQGSAADIIKMAMLAVAPKVASMKSRLLLQVHDELLFEYPPDEEKKLCRLVREAMEGAARLKVPLEVSLKSGSSWGELAPLNG